MDDAKKQNTAGGLWIEKQLNDRLITYLEGGMLLAFPRLLFCGQQRDQEGFVFQQIQEPTSFRTEMRHWAKAPLWEKGTGELICRQVIRETRDINTFVFQTADKTRGLCAFLLGNIKT